MSKAIIVMDMPKSCDVCDFCEEVDDSIWTERFCGFPGIGECVNGYIRCRPYLCPLKELPEKKEVVALDGLSGLSEYYAKGQKVETMKADEKTLMAVKNFIENEQEFWDKEGVISEIVEETGILKNEEVAQLSPDECEIEWDGESICNLDDFIRAFFEKSLEKFCGILDSFVGDDINCCFKEE